MKRIVWLAYRMVAALVVVLGLRDWNPTPRKVSGRLVVLLTIILTSGSMVAPAPNAAASSGLMMLTSQTSGNRDQRLVVGTNEDGRQQLLTVGADSQLYTSYQTVVNGGFSPWSSLGGSWSSQDSIGVGQNQDGRLQLFMVGTDDLLYTTYQTAINAGFHQPWVPLLGRTFDSQDRIGVGQNQDGRLQVFMVGTDNVLYTSYQTPLAGDGFSSWFSLGGSWSSQDSIAIGQNLDGRLQLFMVGTDSVLKTSYQTPLPNGGFSSWVPFAGSWSSQDSVAVGQNQDGRLQISLIGTDGNFHTSYQTVVNGGFSPWGLVPSPVCGGPPQCAVTGTETFPSNDSVAVASTQDGRIVLFAIASDGQPWTSFQDAIDGGGEPPIGGNGGFTFWQNLACNVFAPGPIAAGSNQDGRIQVYGFGGNNVVLTTYESGANNEGFSCPVSLGQPPLVANPTVTGVSPNTGPGGTQVTITGAGFSATPGQTSFSFGTSLATGVSCTSQTLCTAVTPSGVGTVDVIATVNGYSSSSNPPADRFTYDSCGDGPPGSPIVAIPHGSGPDSGISLQVSEPYDSGVAAFVGPAGLPASSYQVTILWGDGTSSAGSVQPISVLGAPACVVSGSHTYDRVGHYSTTVILGSPFDVAFSGQDVGVSPAQAAPMPAVGVLTSDNGPQCTATVVNLAASSDSSNPGFARVVQVLQRHFNFSGNVVVTAQHCLVQDSQGHYGFMFAPGFQGTAPAASKDFTSGIVSSGATNGKPIGHAPLGVWGCSWDSSSNRECGSPFGLSDAQVMFPTQPTGGCPTKQNPVGNPKRCGDASLDYAFLVFKTTPQGESRSLVQVTGGLPFTFNETLATGTRLQHIGYDPNWLDSNYPGGLSGWFDLVNPPEQLNTGDLNCNGFPGSGTQEESCGYYYSESDPQPHQCSPTVDEYADLTYSIGLHETRPSVLASQCNLGYDSSGSPFMVADAVVGIARGGLHAGTKLDPSGANPCCTQIMTPLRSDAAFFALSAELQG